MAWTEQDLRDVIAQRLRSPRVIVVSNRGPLAHEWKNERLTWARPAGGVTTALDPVLKACGGTWIAQGFTDADRFACDANAHVGVPPDKPRYQLRRVFLPNELQTGFYDGLANGALWPLCHHTFQRPDFDPAAWDCYRVANEIFADAVLEEAGSEPAFVFIQDYHFALLPQIIKERNPNLIVGQFWHIPWPNAEILRVFPWHKELLRGLLGNDLLGFHLRTHCANFMTAVEQNVEAIVDSVQMEVRRSDRTTLVRPFPISIDFTTHSELASSPQAAEEARAWRQRIGSWNGEWLGIAIDRVDYTKGIPERLKAVDALFAAYPEYRGKVKLVQIGVPSRENVPAYAQLSEDIHNAVRAINQRWGFLNWEPISYFHEQFSQVELMGLHRLADFCVVSSLHDGMNLVAKEYVASRTDEDGVLVLSQFAGAAAELTGAVQFNPFHLELARDSIRAAIEMPEEERRARMRKLREVVAENNIFRWAGKIMSNFAKLEPSETPAGTTWALAT